MTLFTQTYDFSKYVTWRMVHFRKTRRKQCTNR